MIAIKRAAAMTIDINYTDSATVTTIQHSRNLSVHIRSHINSASFVKCCRCVIVVVVVAAFVLFNGATKHNFDLPCALYVRYCLAGVKTTRRPVSREQTIHLSFECESNAPRTGSAIRLKAGELNDGNTFEYNGKWDGDVVGHMLIIASLVFTSRRPCTALILRPIAYASTLWFSPL